MKIMSIRPVGISVVLCLLVIAPTSFTVTIGEAETVFNFPWGNP